MVGCGAQGDGVCIELLLECTDPCSVDCSVGIHCDLIIVIRLSLQ